MMKCRKSTDI